MGTHRVDLVLKDGRVIEGVIVAWGDEVINVGKGQKIVFDPNQVVDARPSLE